MNELNYLEKKSIEKRAIEEALLISQLHGHNGINLYLKVFSEVGTKASDEHVFIQEESERKLKESLLN